MLVLFKTLIFEMGIVQFISLFLLYDFWIQIYSIKVLSIVISFFTFNLSNVLQIYHVNVSKWKYLDYLILWNLRYNLYNSLWGHRGRHDLAAEQQHKIHCLKIHDSVIFSIFARLWTQNHYLILEHFHHPQRNPLIH